MVQKVLVGQKILFSMEELGKMMWVIIWLLGLTLILAGLGGIYKVIAQNVDLLTESVMSLILGSIAFIGGAHYHDKA
jgi:hypothetical protein